MSTHLIMSVAMGFVFQGTQERVRNSRYVVIEPSVFEPLRVCGICEMNTKIW